MEDEDGLAAKSRKGPGPNVCPCSAWYVVGNHDFANKRAAYTRHPQNQLRIRIPLQLDSEVSVVGHVLAELADV